MDRMTGSASTRRAFRGLVGRRRQYKHALERSIAGMQRNYGEHSRRRPVTGPSRRNVTLKRVSVEAR